MPPKQSIKIVKRKQRESLAAREDAPECELKTETKTRREICETIASWIEEQRKTKQALHERTRQLLRDLSNDAVEI
jgi:hypothetical protein